MLVFKQLATGQPIGGSGTVVALAGTRVLKIHGVEMSRDEGFIAEARGRGVVGPVFMAAVSAQAYHVSAGTIVDPLSERERFNCGADLIIDNGVAAPAA